MKSREERPEPVNILLDETIAGKLIVSGLNEQGISAMPLSDIAPRGVSDMEVLDALAGRPDLYLLTRDKHFRYHSAIRQRLLDAGVGVFVITSAGNKTAAQLVEIVASAWKGIQRFARKNSRPFVAKVTAAGKVEAHR